MTIIGALNRVLYRWDYKLIIKSPDYFHPQDIVPKARQRNLSLCEYMEEVNLGGVGRRRDFIMDALRKCLPSSFTNILEIGAGTGMFLEKALIDYSPVNYEVYERSRQWADYLEQTYSKSTHLKCHNADGVSLSQTASESVDAVFSHGVFVYIPQQISFGYWEEIARVTKPGGWIIFDCHFAEDFDVNMFKQWQNDPHRPDHVVTVSKKLIEEYADRYGLTCVHRFNAPYHASFSTYSIFRKGAPEKFLPIVRDGVKKNESKPDK